MEHPVMTGLSDWKLLAQGDLTEVWQASQLPPERLVAVKIFRRELAEGVRSRFLREAAAGGRLSDHPGMVTAYDAGILPDARPYLIMELCPGGSLAEWLKPENHPSEEQVRKIGLRIADALAAAHASGVLHRDVKPANILIDSQGDPRLADFGLAALLEADADAADAPPVTSNYAPPEAFRKQPATESSDVFSLAATLYALLAGSPPRTVGSAPGTPPQPTEVERPITPIPGVSGGLMDVLMMALADDPAARPTAARFFGQLARVPLRTSKRRRPVGVAKGASAEPSPSRRRRRIVILALAALVVVIASTTAWLIGEPASSGGPAASTLSAPPSALTPGARPSEVVDPPPSSANPSQVVDPTPSTSTTTPGSGDHTSSSPAEEKSIQLQAPARSAKPFETIQIQGTYRGGADTVLRVQRWESGRWLAFPLPTTTDQSGQFTAYVELGALGRHRLRVLDPESGLTSKTMVLVIKD